MLFVIFDESIFIDFKNYLSLFQICDISKAPLGLRMTVYYPKHTDSLTLDYTIGTCLILIFLVSTTLNPLSFLYHIQRDTKLSSRLYALLALLDFIVNIYSPLFQAHNFFKETEDLSPKAKIEAIIEQGISYPSSWLSQIVINVLIYSRLFTIKFPFASVKRNFIQICLSYAILHLLVFEFAMIAFSENYWVSELQATSASNPTESGHHSVEHLIYVLCVVAPMAVIYILGGISSIYTVFLLTRDTGPSETREQKRKSVRIILTLSIVNWSVPIAMIYAFFNWPENNSNTSELVAAYVIINGIRLILSALDPVVVFVLSRDFRARVQYLIRRWYAYIRDLTRRAHDLFTTTRDL